MVRLIAIVANSQTGVNDGFNSKMVRLIVRANGLGHPEERRFNSKMVRLIGACATLEVPHPCGFNSKMVRLIVLCS